MLTHPVASWDKSCNTRSRWIFTAYSRSCAPKRNAWRRRSSLSNGWPLAACRNGAGGPLGGWRRRKQPHHPCWPPKPGRPRRNAGSVRRHGNGWRKLKRKDGQLGKPPRKRPEHCSRRQKLGIGRALLRLPACPGDSFRPRKYLLSLPAVGDRYAVCEIPSSAGVELSRVSKTGTGRSLAGLSAGSLLFEDYRPVDSFALEEHRRDSLGR
jgi:hypothetical protein